MDAGIGGYGDVDLHYDGPIESMPLGQIHFSLIYDDQKKALMVKIVEACHLPLPKPACDVVAAPPVNDVVQQQPNQQQQQQQEQQPPASSSSSSSSFTPIRHRKDPPHSNP